MPACHASAVFQSVDWLKRCNKRKKWKLPVGITHLFQLHHFSLPVGQVERNGSQLGVSDHLVNVFEVTEDGSSWLGSHQWRAGHLGTGAANVAGLATGGSRRSLETEDESFVFSRVCHLFYWPDCKKCKQQQQTMVATSCSLIQVSTRQKN